MSYLEIVDLEHGLFDPEVMKTKGLELQERYRSAEPFPHIAIDDFISPSILDLCLDQFPSERDPDSRTFDRNQERYKTSYNPDYLSPDVRAFFYSLNSRPFIQFLENLSGIKGLIPDPYYLGGGFHETRTGGHLDVHTDFNLHRPMNLERRLNILIYLNKDWRLEYGGGLELWDEKMASCVQAVSPEFGRCVVFSTNDTSFHGHPRPVNHPLNAPRRSIALYYYTATWNDASRPKTTQFKARPGTKDVADWKVRRNELINEFLPPVLSRPVMRAVRKIDRSAKKR
ncbi:MAG: 2OG-Fe(II) oxygenase [Parvularculaceae bacterium]|nr:2OG-Fe(II) oxygenase [Parvularculaceae bacterium]